MLWALAAGLAVLLAAFTAPLWQLGRSAAPTQGLPWQAQPSPEGTLAVFGLVLGRDTLADAQSRIGDGLQVALIARLGEVGSLEALADPFAAGFVRGRLVLAFDAPAPALRRWREQAPRSEAMSDGVRRFALRAGDRDEARRATLSGLSFVPSVRLSEADVRQRFGAPAAVVELGAGVQALLYPAIAMAATLGGGSRSVLQYVAARDFESRLRAPLLAAATAAAAPAASVSRH